MGLISGYVNGTLILENVNITNSVVEGNQKIGGIAGTVGVGGNLKMSNVMFENTFVYGCLEVAKLSVYMIYILPDEQLKTIVTAVVAALYGGILTLVGVAWTIRHSDKERREEEKKKAKPIFTFNMVLEEIKDIRTKKVCFDVAENEIEYKFHVVAEIENSDHSLFEVKRVFHDGKWNEIEGNTVVLPNKSVYFDFRFNYDVNNLFLEVKDGLDNSYYYEIKVLSLNLLPSVVQNSNAELLHTIRELKEISIDEINKMTTKR